MKKYKFKNKILSYIKMEPIEIRAPKRFTLRTIEQSIDCDLMDTKNIAKIIYEYSKLSYIKCEECEYEASMESILDADNCHSIIHKALQKAIHFMKDSIKIYLRDMDEDFVINEIWDFAIFKNYNIRNIEHFYNEELRCEEYTIYLN